MAEGTHTTAQESNLCRKPFGTIIETPGAIWLPHTVSFTYKQRTFVSLMADAEHPQDSAVPWGQHSHHSNMSQRICTTFLFLYLAGKGSPRAFTKSHEGGCATYLMHGNSLRMYTSAMSWDHQSWTSANSLAISSTYIEASKLTVAVIFGCSEQQMARVEELLASCPEVKSHPLLTVGIFAELHKDRIQEIVKKAIYECNAAFTDLKLDRDAPPLVKRDFKLNRKLRNWRLKTKIAEEEVRTTKGLLQKMISQVEEEQQLQSFQYDGEFATSTRRFKQRFTEIEIELDALMARCRMMFDDMTYSEELVSLFDRIFRLFLAHMGAEVAFSL